MLPNRQHQELPNINLEDGQRGFAILVSTCSMIAILLFLLTLLISEFFGRSVLDRYWYGTLQIYFGNCNKNFHSVKVVLS